MAVGVAVAEQAVGEAVVRVVVVRMRNLVVLEIHQTQAHLKEITEEVAVLQEARLLIMVQVAVVQAQRDQMEQDQPEMAALVPHQAFLAHP